MSTSYAIGDYGFLDNTGVFFGAGLDSKIYFDGADLIIASQNVTAADEVHFVDWTGVDFGAAAIATSGTLGAGASTLASAVIGGATNKTTIDASGDISQAGTARRNWLKYTAASVTTANGTSADTVSLLQTAHDGNFHHVVETAGTPFTSVVEFTGVTAFNWVQSLAVYDGSSSHGCIIQLYDWVNTRWDTYGYIEHNALLDVGTASLYFIENQSFTVPDDVNYVSTTGNGPGGVAGVVRVRYAHSAAGVANHDFYVDVCALYQ